MIRSIKLQVRMKRVVRENVSMVFLRDACAWMVRKSASSRITTLILLNDAVLEKDVTLSLIVSIPRSSEALMYS